VEEKEGGQDSICREPQGSNPGCMYLVPGALAPGIFVSSKIVDLQGGRELIF
jgi:hypothetical protein